jgi:hypothetical protein
MARSFFLKKAKFLEKTNSLHILTLRSNAGKEMKNNAPRGSTPEHTSLLFSKAKKKKGPLFSSLESGK